MHNPDHDAIAALGAKFYKKTLWAAVTRPVGGPETLAPLLLEHLRFQISLEKQGVLFAAGPLTPPNTEGPSGIGLIVLRADNEAAARDILDRDPLHRAGLRTYELNRWDLHEGRISLNIDLSDSTFHLD